MDLEQTIRDAAEKFAQQVVDTLRGMTLDELAGIVRSPVASTAGATARKVRTAKAVEKLRMTPERKAALKVQGQYIGLIRGLPAAQKAAMKKLAGKSGMAAAVAVMLKAKK
jgi:hypothetical protein